MRGISRRTLIACSLFMLPVLTLSAGAAQNEINGVNVVPAEGSVRIEISTVGDVTFNAFTMSEPNRLVINCVGARYSVPWQSKDVASPLVSRVRMSQFQLDPLAISRVVLDLGTAVDYTMWSEGGKQIVEVKKRGNESPRLEVADASMGPFLPYLPNLGAEGSASSASPSNVKAQSPKFDPPAPVAAAPVAEPAAPAAAPVAAPKEAPASPWVSNEKAAESPADAASAAFAADDDPYSPFSETEEAKPASSPWTESYARGNPAAGSGRGMGSNRITIDAQGADIKTVLRTISDYSGKNIVYGPDVKGEVYVHIKDVPWEEALDILLKAHGYGYREEFGMIRVSEMQRLTKEEIDLQTAERKKDDLLPLMTRIIFVNNSSAEELKNALQNISSQRGKIDVDQGSNALVVNDIEPVIEKISEMVKSLDKKTFQVDIDAKLVEVDVEATRELGINWGLLNLHAAGFSGIASAEVMTGLSSPAGTVKFGTVRSWGELNAVLDMLEKSNKADIISNPRITTMDNREASILVGKEIPLIVADEAGNPITEMTKIGIMLRVVPHVNADRTITLDLHPEVSELQSESTAQGGVIISTSEADTRVVVSNGETAVIGGLIKNVTTSLKRGVPLLKDVPIIGGLFSSSSKASKKQELVIFVTPKIVE